MALKIKNIKSRAIPLRGNDIDTDRIIPARFLKCITFEGLGVHAFEDDRAQEKSKGKIHPFDNSLFSEAAIMVVNKNFGCGSSREHAPQSLYRYGIRAIVGESFAGIFFGNCISIGIPCFTLKSENILAIQNFIETHANACFEINLEALTIKSGELFYKLEMSESVRDQFISGLWDATGLLMDNINNIKRVAESLPYFKWQKK